MLNIFTQIANTISALITFVINLVTSFVSFISYIPTYITFITQSIALMPAILIPFATACISIYFLLFMVGRQS